MKRLFQCRSKRHFKDDMKTFKVSPYRHNVLILEYWDFALKLLIKKNVCILGSIPLMDGNKRLWYLVACLLFSFFVIAVIHVWKSMKNTKLFRDGMSIDCFTYLSLLQQQSQHNKLYHESIFNMKIVIFHTVLIHLSLRYFQDELLSVAPFTSGCFPELIVN